MKINAKLDTKKIGEGIKTISAGLSLVIALFSVVAGVFNYLTARELGPYIQELRAVKAAQAANDMKDAKEHPTFVTHAELQKSLDAVTKVLDNVQKDTTDIKNWIYSRAR